MADERPIGFRAAHPLLLTLLALGCAVPVPPSGGPADTTPPSLVASEPANQAVRTRPDRVRLEFDEYVDERSVAQAVSITPAPSRAPEIRYGGRSVEIRFREPLRDSTTYIVTLDTGFRDAHGVALTTPISLAFATGDEIDSGRLTGRVLDAGTGRPVSGADVFAYLPEEGLRPDSVRADPAYRTQTDGEGRFAFAYLAERPFLVIAGRDVNRNRRFDPSEPLAVPPDSVLRADSTGGGASRPWLLAPRDSEAPDLRRAAARSSSRLELLFSEGVRLLRADPEPWTVTDSSGSRRHAVQAVGLADGDARTLLLRTDSLGAGWWIVRADSAVADSADNVVSRLEATVAAVGAADTVLARFRAFTGDTLGGAPTGLRVLAPGARAGIRFSNLVTRQALAAALAVRDTTGAPVPVRLEADGSTGWTVVPDPGLPAGRIFELSLAPFPGDAADTTWTARYTAAGPDRLGELSGVVDPVDLPAVLELVPAGTGAAPVRRVRADTTGRFVFDRLPGGRRYRLRVVRDLDGDARWSPGSVHPFSPSEPVGWLDTLPAVRSRWETALPDTVRIGTPPDRVPPAPGS